jgi:hypothetical protein
MAKLPRGCCLLAGTDVATTIQDLSVIANYFVCPGSLKGGYPHVPPAILSHLVTWPCLLCLVGIRLIFISGLASDFHYPRCRQNLHDQDCYKHYPDANE